MSSAKPVDAWWEFSADSTPLPEFKPTIGYPIYLTPIVGIDVGSHVFTLLLTDLVLRLLQVRTEKRL